MSLLPLSEDGGGFLLSGLAGGLLSVWGGLDGGVLGVLGVLGGVDGVDGVLGGVDGVDGHRSVAAITEPSGHV